MPEENLFQRRDAKDSQAKQPNSATNSYQGPTDKSDLRDRGEGYSASAKVVDYGHGNKPGNDYSGKSLFVCQSHHRPIGIIYLSALVSMILGHPPWNDNED